MPGFGFVPPWLEGALICLIGSTLTALGLVLQKYSHIVESDEREQQSDQRNGWGYFLRKWWLVGFLVFLSAQLVNMVAMAMTPQIVLSCLGSWTLVCNTIFARRILGEKISRAQSVAVAGLVVSAALVLCFAPQPSDDADSQPRRPQALAARLGSIEFKVLSALLLFGAAAMRAVAMSLDFTWSWRGFLAGALTTDAVEEEGITRSTPASRRRAVVPVSWATVAAVAGGYTALFVKCVALLLTEAGASIENQSLLWACWESYMMAALALLCAPMELHCLNLALQCGEAVLVVPTYLALSMLAQLATGAVFFQEFRDFNSTQQICGFGLGVAITLLFVVMVAKVQAVEAEQIRRSSTNEWKAIDVPEAALPPELLGYLNGISEGGEDVNPMAPNQVSVAGFGGAIEYLDSVAGTPKGVSLPVSFS